MIKKLSSALAAVMLLFTGANAQSVLKGKVTDAEGKPLFGTAIQINETSLGAIADGEGEYEFSNLKAGDYTLLFSYLGMEPVKKEVTLSGIVVLDIVMLSASYVSEGITITAVRAEEDEPVSQVTRDLKTIEANFQGQDAGFLLEKLSPSIVTYSESGTNFSNYSGFRLRGMDQTRVNMTLNGVPLNDMIDQGVFFSNFTDFGNSIQSVQIQRGAGTSSNGTSSYAGSINFESINVYDTVPSAQVQLTGGSFNTFRASAEVQTGKMENNLAFYARYAGMTSDGFRDNTGTDSRSFFFSGAYFAKKHTLKFTGFVGRAQNELGYSPVAIEDIRINPRTNYISPNDVDDFGQWMAQFQHNYQISNRLSLVSTVYVNGAGGDFPFGFEDGEGTFTQINYPLSNRHIGAMSQLNMRSADNKTRLNFGVHGYTFGRENIEQIIPDYDNPYYEDESRKNEIAAFVKARHSFGSLTVFGDVQLRAVRLMLTPDSDFLGSEASIPDRDWLFVNPRAGVTYALNERYSAYASIGRTGREPTRFDILGSTQINSGNLAIAQDEDAVKPEYVNDLEAGAKVRGQNFAVNANLFFMQFENEIAPIGAFIPEGFVQVYENQESSYRTGIELDYSWRILPMLRLYGNATYMQSRISEYTPEGADITFDEITPILSPDWNVRASIEVEIVDELFIYLSTRYLSESYLELTNNPELIIPESFVADAGVRYTILEKYEIKVDLNNVFDNLYYTNGAPVATANGLSPGYFVQPPRHVFATMTMRF
ncbi:MAG: iron complex outermembrane receptor protein [Flammeovirgaceae bacterium]|jgi:iron complex outermembrane receptor protein